MFTLTPQPYAADGFRVKFDCDECGHSEVFVRMRHDVSHVLGWDHYREECPATRSAGEEHPQIAEHRRELARRHRD